MGKKETSVAIEIGVGFVVVGGGGKEREREGRKRVNFSRPFCCVQLFPPSSSRHKTPGPPRPIS